jgi:hypothetical protein
MHHRSEFVRTKMELVVNSQRTESEGSLSVWKIQMIHLRPSQCSNFFRCSRGRSAAIRSAGRLRASNIKNKLAKASESTMSGIIARPGSD